MPLAGLQEMGASSLGRARRLEAMLPGTSGPTPGYFFASADCKEVAGESLVSAHSKGLKAAVFSVTWERLVSADFKGVTRAVSILIGILPGTAHSKGVRRTAWRGRMVRRALRDRVDLTRPL